MEDIEWYDGEATFERITPTGATMTMTKVGHEIDVKNAPFNAVGDGVTDDTTAIQAAIDAFPINGGRLYIPYGAYLISSELTTGDKEIEIYGDGRGKDNEQLTRIIVSHNGHGFNINAGLNRQTHIHHLRIEDGYGASRTQGSGIHVERTEDDACAICHLHDLSIHEMYDGISGVSLVTSEFARIVAKDNLRYGFHLYGKSASVGGTSTTFKTCFATSNDSHGFYLTDHNYILLSNCASDVNDKGYYLGITNRTAIAAVNLIACGAESNSDDGVFVTTCQGLNVIGLCSTSNGSDGLHFENTDGFVITGGKYQGNTGYGINVNPTGGALLDERGVILTPSLLGNTAGSINDTNSVATQIRNRKLINVDTISTTTTASNNLRGRVTINDPDTSGAVTFGTAEPDTGYFVIIGISNATAGAALNSKICWVTSKATSGFTINIGAAAGEDQFVQVDWLLIR